MDKYTAKVTSKSIEQSGLPTDYRKAIAEYIWNSFDARATEVHINFDGNSLGHLSSFSISDNGTGIDFQNIQETFGNFLDSNKRDPFNKDSFQKGRKGKGRFAFKSFANNCVWETTFIGPDEKTFRYTITINNGDLQNFATNDRAIVKGAETGTVVSFYNILELSPKSLASKDFKDFLSGEFGWFLFLNRDKNYNIVINGLKLAFDEIIGDSAELVQEIGNHSFKIVFIRWNLKIGDKYYFYFLSHNQKEAAKKHTSFNNKAIDFHHSVYVESSFFDDFQETADDNPVLGFSGKNQSDPSYKSLVKALTTLVAEKEKHFIRDIQADRLIDEYNAKGIFPEPKIKTQEVESVVKELYCAEPRIFHSLNNQQSKTMVGLINLLIATDQSPNIMEVIESVVALTEEERESLSRTL